jgi:cytidylate kinase
VCKLLGYRYFDKTMLAQVAADLELSEAEAVDFSEDNYKIQGFLERILGWSRPEAVAQVKSWTVDVTGAKTPTVINLDEAHSTTLTRITIERAYEHGNIVIVGRGGQAILKDRPAALHVRIVASFNARVQRLHDRANMSYGGAKDTALKHDFASAEYLKRFHDIDWADPMQYDLVINTSRLSLETAAQLIIQAVASLPAGPESTAANEKAVHA